MSRLITETLQRSTPRGWRTYQTENGPRKFPVENILQKQTDKAGSGVTVWALYVNVCAGIAESVEQHKTLDAGLRAFVRAGRRKRR